MRNPKKPGPPEDRIDNRIIVLGVVGSLLLAVVFFSLTSFYMRSKTRTVEPSAPRPSYSERARTYTPPPPPAPEPVPQVDLKITEHPTAGDASVESADEYGDGVEQDGEGLTLKLEPEKPKQPKRPNEPEKPDTPTETDKPKPAATEKGSFRVQVGTFSDKDNAAKVASGLTEKGFNMRVNPVEVEGRTLYRVQISEPKSRKDADKIADELRSQGYEPAVIAEKKAE